MKGAPTIQTTSRRPYLIRAMYDWVLDNGLTPHVLVDATFADVRVPLNAVKDGHIVLNVAPRAVSQLELGNQLIRFMARFGGVSHSVQFSVDAVQAIYAHENGDGMVFPPEPRAEAAASEGPGAATGLLCVAASQPLSEEAGSERGLPDGTAPPKGRPSLRVVK